jgi:hypothetical protein
MFVVLFFVGHSGVSTDTLPPPPLLTGDVHRTALGESVDHTTVVRKAFATYATDDSNIPETVAAVHDYTTPATRRCDASTPFGIRLPDSGRIHGDMYMGAASCRRGLLWRPIFYQQANSAGVQTPTIAKLSLKTCCGPTSRFPQMCTACVSTPTASQSSPATALCLRGYCPPSPGSRNLLQPRLSWPTRGL